ncbi:hybrid sensor histidine kinase/response regulator [Acaryochloris sp. IP29b_bin.137]|uniref:ATP-binding response regulator n=1 Tax=Acaryochloris sp. IP29b_bin.137 TaxID=2969217 RepID=UPI002601FCD4|nr:hybrid sensor histidine kinase/response regulator [Acaryochloris sp. IP29b_bin.137]
MLFEQTTVGEFSQQTLVCQTETPIQEILDVLQHQSISSPTDQLAGDWGEGIDLSRLVVVNQQQQPVSLIRSAQFIYLFFAEQHSTDAVSPQQPIGEWVNLPNNPLYCVVASESLKQFWQSLQAIAEDRLMSWAITEDKTGKYLGLLDTPKLVQFLAHHVPLSVAIKFSSDLKSSVSTPWELPKRPLASTESSTPEQPSSSAPLSAELLAEISHELKSPLTAILSLSNVLSHQGIQNLSERQLQYIQLIHQKSQQLMSILNTLLDLTRLPMEVQPKAHKAVSLDLLCEDAIAQAKRYYQLEEGTANQAALLIRRHPQGRLGSIYTDEPKLRQILVHLLHNALGLTQGQSPVVLNVTLWQGWTIFTISDQGEPIPHLQQPLIFQIPQTWTQSDQAILGKTGLGLILAQRLVEQLSGDISFISGPKQGNTFSLYVPPEKHRSQRAKITKGLVLLIATTPSLIEQVSQELSEQSLQVVVARAESEALQKVALLRPQAIILQTLLTTGSGWEILSTLRQQTDTLPILLIGSPEDCQQTTKMGGDDCLTLSALQPGLGQWFEKRFNTQTFLSVIAPQQSHMSVSKAANPQKLTILHLDQNLDPSGNVLPSPIDQSLYEHQWRVISTTTLDEAELLVKIWKPDVILYTDDNPAPFLNMADESPLRSFPFVILHPEVQHVALERKDLEVITRASLTAPTATSDLSEVSSLLQILTNATASDECLN